MYGSISLCFFTLRDVHNCCIVNDTLWLLGFRVKDNGVWIIENVFKWLTGNLYRLLSPGDLLIPLACRLRIIIFACCVWACIAACVCYFFLAESLKSDMSVVVNVRVLITRVCLLTQVSNVMRQCVSLWTPLLNPRLCHLSQTLTDNKLTGGGKTCQIRWLISLFLIFLIPSISPLNRPSPCCEAIVCLCALVMCGVPPWV